jgi:hypothetical protein
MNSSVSALSIISVWAYQCVNAAERLLGATQAWWRRVKGA